MPRSHARSGEAVGAPGRPRNRHGRGARASVTGPELPPLHNRIEFFEATIASTVEYLLALWPELADVRFEVAAAPPSALAGDEVDRWSVDPASRTVTMFRVPIQRLAKLHRNDEVHRRAYLEGCVFRAVGELLGKDPWDLAPDRFRHW